MFPIAIMMIENEDDRAFMQGVYTQYRGLIYSSIVKVFSVSEEYEDVINEVCIALIKKISLLRTFPCYKLRAYIVSTSKHVAISYAIRYSKYRARTTTEDDIIEVLPSDEDSAEEMMEIEAEYDELRAALRLLPEREKQLLMMKHLLNMSDDEIAAELGIKPKSVHVYVSRAKKVAKNILDQMRQDEKNEVKARASAGL